MKTHWKKLHNPDYFGSWCIPEGEDLIVTIKQIKVEQITGEGGRVEQLSVCYFQEKQKPLILNVTNSKQIQSIYGTPYIEDWVGKQIQLFKSTTKMKGEVVDCVRVRPLLVSKQKPAFTPNNERWKGAVEAIFLGDSTIEAVKKHYTLSNDDEALMKQQILKLNENEPINA